MVRFCACPLLIPDGICELSGIRNDEIVAVRLALEGFVIEVFASLPRKDQRAKDSLYLPGLMLDGRRKSMVPMGSRQGIDYQQLQQFVLSSPWVGNRSAAA